MRKCFCEINIEKYKDYNIILDIDGTLCAEGENLVGEREKAVVNRLKENNFVYIFSNNTNGERSRDVARQVNCEYLEAPYRKPCKKIIQYLPDTKKPILVIGDKFLTDVIFAKRIKAEFILVKSMQSENDRWFIKLFNFIDDIIINFVKI